MESTNGADASRNLSTGLQLNNATQLQEQKVTSKALAYELRFSENIDSKYQELKQRNEAKYENDLVSVRKCVWIFRCDQQ